MNLGYGSEGDANYQNSKPDRKRKEEVGQPSCVRKNYTDRNAVHGRETVVARHVPAAIHGFAALGNLKRLDAMILRRRVQVDMRQEERIQDTLNLVVARPFALQDNRCPASSPVLNLRTDAACWRPLNQQKNLSRNEDTWC